MLHNNVICTVKYIFWNSIKYEINMNVIYYSNNTIIVLIITARSRFGYARGSRRHATRRKHLMRDDVG